MIRTQTAQSTVEYLVLLGAITAIVLVGFNSFILRSQEQANVVFNEVANGIMGDSLSDGAASGTRTNYP